MSPPQILAPTDDAFDKLLVTLGGANGRLPLDALLRQPALKDILLYHIVPGRYSSGECIASPHSHVAQPPMHSVPMQLECWCWESKEVVANAYLALSTGGT